jgi:hypothetical protein
MVNIKLEFFLTVQRNAFLENYQIKKLAQMIFFKKNMLFLCVFNYNFLIFN